MTKLRLSPSKLMVWKDCPRRFQAEYTREVTGSSSIYTAIGTAAHTILDRLNKGWEATPDEREKAFWHETFEECKKQGVSLDFNKTYRETKKTLREYAPPAGFVFLQGEQKRILEFPDFDFVYIVDAIFTDNEEDHLNIWDYKTSAKVPSNPLQLICYAWGERERLKRGGLYISGDNITVAYYMTRGDKIVEYRMTEKTLDEFGEWLFSQVGIMQGLFAFQKESETKIFPATKGDGCHFCTVVSCPSNAMYSGD